MRAFLAVQTQWATGFNGPTGLDYTRARDGLAMAGIEVTKELFDQLRLLEAGVLGALAEKSKTKST